MASFLHVILTDRLLSKIQGWERKVKLTSPLCISLEFPECLFDISIIKNKAILLTSPLLGTVSFLGDLCLSYVVVQVQVGKQFPDMRQNEREVKFIRVRRASGLCCLLEQQASSGRTSIEQGSLVHFYTEGTRSGIRPCGSFADWRRHVY